MNTPPDTPDSASAHPAHGIDGAKQFEAALFGGDETREWPAMQRAGRAIAGAVLRDFRELGAFPAGARVLVLAGKGHNAGDALITARRILEKHPGARMSVCLAFGERALRPLALRAWRELASPPGGADILPAADIIAGGMPALPEFALCLDGIFGFQFRPPLDERTAALIARVNALPILMRAAIDLPSGLGGETVFRADFTYATGIVKTPALDSAHCGRLRYLDLGFFSDSGAGGRPAGLGGAGGMGAGLGRDENRHGRDARDAREHEQDARDTQTHERDARDTQTHERDARVTQAHGQDARDTQAHERDARDTQAHGQDARDTRDCGRDDCAIFVLTPAILAPLRTLRASRTDKRDFGHLFVVGGSRTYPGAVLMSVLAALRSGAGLVTAFVPGSLVPAFAAQAPEAIWRGMAESPGGALVPADFSMLREHLDEAANSTGRPTAILLGPGLSRDSGALSLAGEIVSAAGKTGGIPLVLDADALQPGIVAAGKSPRILTPHAGEHRRVAAAIPGGAVVVRKGALTQIERDGKFFISPHGGPALARGGSGDLLAGIIGGLLAQAPRAPLLAACRGVVWHGMAADCMARARGQHAVRATQLLDYLPEALRDEIP